MSEVPPAPKVKEGGVEPEAIESCTSIPSSDTYKPQLSHDGMCLIYMLTYRSRNGGESHPHGVPDACGQQPCVYVLQYERGCPSLNAVRQQSQSALSSINLWSHVSM